MGIRVVVADIGPVRPSLKFARSAFDAPDLNPAERVGSSGVARVRDRPQACGVEDVRDRPLGHYVHDPGAAGSRGYRFRPGRPALR